LFAKGSKRKAVHELTPVAVPDIRFYCGALGNTQRRVLQDHSSLVFFKQKQGCWGIRRESNVERVCCSESSFNSMSSNSEIGQLDVK
jgi:hypothetical protein